MARLTSIIRFVLGFIFIMVMTLIVMAACLVLLPFRIARIYVCNWWGHVVGRGIVFLAGVTMKVNNHERLKGSMPAIFVMNHASTLDAFSGIWMCPYGGCGVFKKEIVKVPFYGQLAWMSGHLLLDRNNTGKAVETLKNMATFMQKNRLGIWIFPEGTRARDGRLLPFKKGFVHMAIATGFPVVPVVVHGAHKNWEKGKFTFNPMTLDVDVLPPIDTKDWKEETAGEHAKFVHDVFAGALRDDQKPLPLNAVEAAASAVVPARPATT
ncbi:MAG: 1-acyl-sn-glycerol-3-phosphate acyltransferase [Myxococcus sp.]|nr:1-acyl-sn-glycerol-3-phosphate acyltransferase [Myxococcus sp.]